MFSTRRDKSTLTSGMTLMMLVAALFTPVAGASPTSHGFDKAFNEFLYEHGYSGGAAAAIKDGNLLFAEGFGEDSAGKPVTAHSKFQISSVAKSFTGIAIMRLVQEGRLSLDDKVFGNGGLLRHIKPWREETVDKRLRLIKVDHLLRHSCGWDVDQAPLYDPLRNKLYLARGHDVPDIARHIGDSHPIEPKTLISYVISQPLAFTPGTKTAYSNMAYLVLGRVVEAAAKMPYKNFIKRYILEPCGMWNTRLELAPGHEDYSAPLNGEGDAGIDTASADSALGWWSTVYDLMRFTRCTFETGQILNDQYLEMLLARKGADSPRKSPDLDSRSETWYGAGFLTNSRGIVWQDGDTHADDLILYHDLRPPVALELSKATATQRRDNSYRNRRGRRRGRRADADQSEELLQAEEASAREQELELEKAEERERLPESWVVLLRGKSINHIRHYTRDLMTSLETSESSLPKENLFLYDLSDLHRHQAWDPDTAWSWRQTGVTPEGGIQPARRAAPEMTVRYHINEHHLSAYIDALRDEGFDIQWFTSNPDQKETSFLVMGKRIKDPVRARRNFIFKHGMDHRRLLKVKLWLEQGGYNLTQLHSYVQHEHDAAKEAKKGKWAKDSTSFAAIFRYHAFPEGALMKYGTGHLPQPYHKLVQMYHEKEFYPVSQTVTWTRSQKSEEFAFVFIKRADLLKPRTEFLQHYDLSVDELSQTTAKNTKSHLRLAYINAYSAAGGRCRFSAVYTNGTRAKGLLEMGQPRAKASEITISNMRMGLAPKFIVPYKESSKLRYAIYYEEF